MAYISIGLMAGAVVGLLRPLIQWRFGAYLVGLIAGVPVAVGLIICVRGFPQQWDFADRALVPIFVVIAGFVIGRELWKDVAEDRASRSG